MTDVITAAWRDVLGVDHVDEDTDFFDAGGHSLAAIKIVSRLEAEYDVELPVRLLFDYPALGNFARAVEELVRDEAAAL